MLLGVSRSVIQDSLIGICNCLRIFALFVLCELHCKIMFDNEIGALVASYGERRYICNYWQNDY
jgi:hypothetical protein